MAEERSFTSHLLELTKQRVEPGERRAARREYLDLCEQADVFVVENPRKAAGVLWFRFHNPGDVKVRREAIGPLRTLSQVSGFEAQAIEILGKAMGDDDPVVSEQARRVLGGIMRRPRSDSSD